MRTFTHSFDAGETIILPGGSRFEILSSIDALDVSYFVNGNRKLDEVANDVPAGYFFTMPKLQELVTIEGRQVLRPYASEFERVEVYSATAQTVTMGVSRGDSGARGSFVNLSGGKLDEIGPGTMRGSTWQNTIDNIAETIVAPASNVRGIIVSYAVIVATGSGTGRILAKTSAPASWFEGNTIALFQNASGTGVQQYPVLIPQGYGLYAMASVFGGPWGFLEYEVL